MYSQIFIFAFVNLGLFNVANCQALNRLLPSCGPPLLPISETVLPNQLLFPPNFITPNVIDYPYEILPNVPCQVPNILNVPNVPCPQTTIIQDSTVANNLANALQLLVVSNLLSNTLPHNDVVVPNYPPFEIISPLSSMGPLGSIGGYNYLY